MKKLLIFLLLSICSPISAAHAEIAPEKRQEIEKMLRLTGMEKLSGQIVSQMVTAFKKEMPEVPGAFWDKIGNKVDTKELIEKLIPVYDKYYTTDDLKAVNAFYSTPAGQKILATLPQVMQEAIKIGQEWGAQLGREIEAEIMQEKKAKKLR